MGGKHLQHRRWYINYLWVFSPLCRASGAVKTHEILPHKSPSLHGFYMQLFYPCCLLGRFAWLLLNLFHRGDKMGLSWTGRGHMGHKQVLRSTPLARGELLHTAKRRATLTWLRSQVSSQSLKCCRLWNHVSVVDSQLYLVLLLSLVMHFNSPCLECTGPDCHKHKLSFKPEAQSSLCTGNPDGMVPVMIQEWVRLCVWLTHAFVIEVPAVLFSFIPFLIFTFSCSSSLYHFFCQTDFTSLPMCLHACK